MIRAGAEVLPRAEEIGRLNEIDSVCDAFETAWREGQRPSVEAYFRSAHVSDPSGLLVELVRLEHFYRANAGEDFSLEDYVARFPEYASVLTDQQPEDTRRVGTASARPIPKTIGRFEILEPLGAGAFGEVWKARDTTLDRIVALKASRTAHFDSTAETAFRREAQAAAQLRHPHIVGVFGIEQDESATYIIAEYIAGQNLKEWLQKNSPTFETAAVLCVKLADALAHAHGQGVVHRDLKPANIMLDEQGEPHVADFGLAKRLSCDSTQSQRILGSPAYMSPEQAAGDSRQVDGRSDVYSLGVVLFELLTGRRPFEGDPQAIVQRLLTESAPSPRSIRRDVPRDLETICLKATARDRDQRYATAEELAADLRRHLAHKPIVARRPRAALGRTLLTRRNFAGLALSALPVFGYAMWTGGRAPSDGTRRRVAMTTNPVGAKVWFIPLNKLTGEPEPLRIVEAGRSPVEVDLTPGDYLVEAVLDDGRFHEVYRRVPELHEAMPGSFAHQWYQMATDRKSIRFAKIQIPPASVANGMARIPGSAVFEMGIPGSKVVPAHYRHIPPFLLDPLEVTYGACRSLLGKDLPAYLNTTSQSENHAIPLSFDNAVNLAERLGKRLMDEAEYEFAATANGSRASFGPAPLAGSSTLGPVGSPVIDRVELDPQVPVFGLCSNVAEWVMNYANAYPGVSDTVATSQNALPGEFRVIRGGKRAFGSHSTHSADEVPDARHRRSCWRHTESPGLGLRSARSTRPRLEESDFVRLVYESAEGAYGLTDSRDAGIGSSFSR